MVILYFILLFVWGFIILGIGFQGYATLASFQDKTYVTLGRMIAQRLIRPIWYIWIILGLVIGFGPKFFNGYYDFYAAEINSQLFASIMINSLFFALIMLLYRGFILSDKSFAYLMFVTAIFYFLVSIFYTFPRTSQQLQALITGPKHKSGVVQGTHSYSVVRSGMVYYVDVDEDHYQTPDADWFKSIEVGKKLEYAYSPYVTLLTPEIFDPQKSHFTMYGIIIIFCGFIFWFLGACLAIDGWLAVLSRRRAKLL